MRDRSSKSASYSVDLVLMTAMGDELAILLARNSSQRERWSVPWRIPQSGEALDGGANRAAQDALGEFPAWMVHVGAFGDGKRHPSENDVSVAYAALVPDATASARAG